MAVAVVPVVLFLFIVGMNVYDTLSAERQVFPDVAALPQAATLVLVALFLLVHLGICAILAAAIVVTLRTYAGVGASMSDVFFTVGHAHVPLVVWALFARYEVIKFKKLIALAHTEAIDPEIILTALHTAQATRVPAYVLAVLLTTVLLRARYRLPTAETAVVGLIVPLGVGALVWATGLL